VGAVVVHDLQAPPQVASSSKAMVVGLVPSERVVVRSIELPGGSRRHLERVVRYAVEDTIAEDVDALHFSQRVTPGSPHVSVMAARHQDMAEWLAAFAGQGVQPDSLLPDFYRLPLFDDGWTVAIEGGRALVRKARDIGFAVQVELLSRCLGTPTDACDRLHLLTGDLGDKLIGALRGGGWRIEEATVSSVDEYPVPGLLTGPYAPVSRSGTRWWRIAVGLLIAAFLVETGTEVYRYRYFVDGATQYDQRSLQVFKQNFPETRRVVDIEAQGTQALQRIQQFALHKERGFLALFDRLVVAVRESSGIGLARVEFRGEELKATLSGGEPQEVAALKASLSRQGLTVSQAGAELRIRWRQDA